MIYRWFIQALFLLVVIAPSALNGAVLHFEGSRPPDLDPLFLETQYHRIWNKLVLDSAVNKNPVTIICYKKREEQRTGVRLPEWGGGGAVGRDTIVIPIDKVPLLDMDINRTCVHELVHIVLARGYGRIHIPRWFHEGMAMTLSGELSSEEQVALSKAIFTNHLLSLDTIENLNRFDRAQADLGYAISHFTVQFLIEIYGLDALPELLHASEHTRSFDNALTETVGLNQKELQQLVNTRMIARFKYLFLTSDGYLAWVGIVLLAVVAFVTIKLRNRKKRRLMEEAESLEEEIMKTEDGKPDEKDSDPDKAK